MCGEHAGEGAALFKVPSGGISAGDTDFTVGARGEGHDPSNNGSRQQPWQRTGDDGARSAATRCSRSQGGLGQGEAAHH